MIISKIKKLKHPFISLKSIDDSIEIISPYYIKYYFNPPYPFINSIINYIDFVLYLYSTSDN